MILDDKNTERLVTDDLYDVVERLTPVARRLDEYDRSFGTRCN